MPAPHPTSRRSAVRRAGVRDGAIAPAPAHVLRVTSVFEPPDAVLDGDGAARFDPIGGMQNHTAQLTRALDARGVRQTVVTTRPLGAADRDFIGERAVVHRHGLPVAFARQLYGPPAARTARRVALRHGIDLVHAHVGEDLAALPIGARAARAAGVPLVVTVHTSLAHTFTPRGLRSRVLKQFGGRIERWACERAAGVIVLTPRLAARLADGGVPAGRIHVIPSGVVGADFASARAAADPFPHVGRPRVLFLGRLHRQKGAAVLIEAVSRMREPAEVVLVGDGPERARLEAAVAGAGLGDRVRFAGFRPHAQVAGILAHADVFAMPSVYEELGTVLLEAMCAGLPIVASATGGIPGAAGGAARLVPPEDPGALAAALDGLLRDPAERARRSRLARERAADFDWKSLADQVLDVYSQTLSGDDVGPESEPESLAALGPVRA